MCLKTVLGGGLVLEQESALPVREGGNCMSPHLKILLLLQLLGYDNSVLCSTAPQPPCFSVILSQGWTEDFKNIPVIARAKGALCSCPPLPCPGIACPVAVAGKGIKH